MAKIIIDKNTPEAGAQNNFTTKYIIIREEKDFVQENVTINKIEVTEDKKSFIVTVENELGETVTSGRKFFPEEGRAKSAESYDKWVKAFVDYFKNIGNVYVGDKFELELDTENWPKAVEDLIKQIKKEMLSTKISAKLALQYSEKDGKYYTNLAGYSPFATDSKSLFISTADREMLKLSKKYSNPNVKADEDSPSKKNEEKNDMPF
jgi:hypothetical protein